MLPFLTKRFGILAVAFLLLFSVSGCAQPTEKEQVLTQLVTQYLQGAHYTPTAIDNTFSKNVFEGVIDELDPNKRFLTLEDIHKLTIYQYFVDDQLLAGRTDFFDLSDQLYNHRILELEKVAGTLIQKPLPTKSMIKFESDPKKRIRAKNSQELASFWEHILTYQTLTTYISKVETTVSGNSLSPTIEMKIVNLLKYPNPKLLKESQEKTQKDLKSLFETLKKEKKQDRFSHYLNSIANQFDPHTDYMAPEEKANFDISITGTLEGIGAVLKDEDGFIKVASVVVGSPAWKQKQLKAGDIVLKVAQGSAEPVDVSGMRVNDAVKLIRGKKGSEVRLTVRKANGQLLTIPIIRDIVELDETYARTIVVGLKGSSLTFGYIYLPVFYHDFNNANARRAAEDVKTAVQNLKQQGVSGIILDLRNNSGGALDDAIRLSGLFIPSGPIVQVRDRSKNVYVQRDPDSAVEYSGPLVVMTNAFSASASEIVAAALQDYGRAVIVGSSHTFGKGTVQTFVNFDSEISPQYWRYKPLGALKLTIQKFYRINGGSTQYKGVAADVLIPDPFEEAKSGERMLPHSLAWDTIPAQPFTKWQDPAPMSLLKAKSAERLTKNPYFQMVKQQANELKQHQDNSIEMLDLLSIWKRQIGLKKQENRLKTFQKTSIQITTPSTEKTKDWFTQVQKDMYLQEALHVLEDWVHAK